MATGSSMVPSTIPPSGVASRPYDHGVDAVGFLQFNRFDRSRADVHTDQWSGFSQHPTLEFE